MKELIGHECIVDFNIPDRDWPIPGYPARAVVEAVEMPMIKLRPRYVGEFWVNVSIIKTIRKET